MSDNDMHRIRRETRRKLRERIDGAQALDTLTAIDKELAERGREMKAVEMGAMKLRVEIARTKLDKVLPDLKAVEHEIGESLAELADSELESRLAQLIGKARTVDAPPGAETTH